MPAKSRKRKRGKRSRFSRRFGKSYKRSKRSFKRTWGPKRRVKTRTESFTSINLRPDKLRVKLKFTYLANSQGLTGGIATYWQFSGNSPWDPDYTGIGATANMWTTLSAWYNKYMCTYSKIFLKAQCQTVGAYQIQGMWQPRTLNQAAASDYRTISAQPYGHFKQHQGSTVSKTPDLKFYGKMSTTKILGRKLDPSLDRVSTVADPNEEYIWEMVLLSSSTIIVNIYGTMTFWVEFSDRSAVSYL